MSVGFSTFRAGVLDDGVPDDGVPGLAAAIALRAGHELGAGFRLSLGVFSAALKTFSRNSTVANRRLGHRQLSVAVGIDLSEHGVGAGRSGAANARRKGGELSPRQKRTNETMCWARLADDANIPSPPSPSRKKSGRLDVPCTRRRMTNVVPDDSSIKAPPAAATANNRRPSMVSQ